MVWHRNVSSVLPVLVAEFEAPLLSKPGGGSMLMVEDAASAGE